MLYMQPYKNPVCGLDYLQHLYALAACIKIYKYTGKAHLVFFLTLFFLLPPATETICSVAVVNSQNSTDLFLLEGGYFRTFVIIFNPIGTVPIWATNHSQRSPFFVKIRINCGGTCFQLRNNSMQLCTCVVTQSYASS